MSILLLVLLVAGFRLNTFIAFLVVCLFMGLALKMDINAITQSITTGIGKTLGGLVTIIVFGSMLGKLVAESGAAQRIANGLMHLFGRKYIQWSLMLTGFIVGIPLFYNIGFVLMVPLIFTVAARTKLPAVYLGIPMLASLSVTWLPTPTSIADCPGRRFWCKYGHDPDVRDDGGNSCHYMCRACFQPFLKRLSAGACCFVSY